jgi:hypothetical protein
VSPISLGIDVAIVSEGRSQVASCVAPRDAFIHSPDHDLEAQSTRPDFTICRGVQARFDQSKIAEQIVVYLLIKYTGCSRIAGYHCPLRLSCLYASERC